MQAFSTLSAARGIDHLIQLDHQSFWDLHDRFRNSGADPYAQQAIAIEIIREVSVHSVAEDIVLYTVIEEQEGKEVADDMRQDHLKVRDQLAQLDAMSVSDTGHAVLVERIMQELRAHAYEEEHRDLPMLRAKLGDDKMIELGAKFAGAKNLVPTRPHPGAPIEPTATLVAGVVVAPVDKVRDLGREFAERKVPEE
ncbi:hypothetical protein BCR44DRAFT_1388174 [Catenaria anguillulae PL171]|uniref:Hemerythrin-like domain-containing protein n=1 Tax=Catenaria anguillulae PL171 TaxID=765915 RepID=A0A1Y2HT84_9FUNG|nr:hypothetical protein BCR44DRAFT_1388174 [Catenaria anguillulae PL171]